MRVRCRARLPSRDGCGCARWRPTAVAVRPHQLHRMHRAALRGARRVAVRCRPICPAVDRTRSTLKAAPRTHAEHLRIGMDLALQLRQRGAQQRGAHGAGTRVACAREGPHPPRRHLLQRTHLPGGGGTPRRSRRSGARGGAAASGRGTDSRLRRATAPRQVTVRCKGRGHLVRRRCGLIPWR